MKRFPFISVTSIRPSGRKASAQGSSNVATGSTMNGGLACACATPATSRLNIVAISCLGIRELASRCYGKPAPYTCEKGNVTSDSPAGTAFGPKRLSANTKMAVANQYDAAGTRAVALARHEWRRQCPFERHADAGV